MNQCKKCLKYYQHRQSLWRHKQKCCLPREDLKLNDVINQGWSTTIKADTSDKIASLNPSSHCMDESSMEENEISSYSLKPSSQDESNMDITNNSELESGSVDSSVDDKEKISSYSLNEPVQRRHSIWLPPNVRAIIVGKSGCGKTTLLSHLLLCPDVMNYDNLVVCGRSLHQPEYRVMQDGFDKGLSNTQVGSLFVNQDWIKEEAGTIEEFIDDYSGRCKGGVDAVFLDDVTAIPDPCEHDSRKKNLLVLDDVMLSPQNKVEAYFTRGRHNNVDVIYITQSYFRLPRQTIRENGNLFIFFKQDRKNLIHIFNDHCAGDGISFERFCNWCNDVWQKGKYNFVTIDLTKPVDFGKYRKNLDYFWLNSIPANNDLHLSSDF